MRDFVSIEGLEVLAVVGIFEWEQEITQPLVIDLKMAWDNRTPAQSGAIEDALDYDAVRKAVTSWISAKPWGLIEEVAEVLAARIIEEFGVAELEVRVAKPTAVASAKTVAVTIHRTRQE
ncbi:dihydroneopterin aldolase [Aliidiomarina shirensis]|uniref:7,8-dihydroneopterin aldolase n=1 Tax=Aliidiomarina shirensis TaxID=1048642 RepID=A0A432WKX1_9GAMM|nr:dihydroneopterin aldolase [Aliidiomarina shirensis]RUO34381.1 dihydroneopterin aldolase [Aliidiomarina shirensis]